METEQDELLKEMFFKLKELSKSIDISALDDTQKGIYDQILGISFWGFGHAQGLLIRLTKLEEMFKRDEDNVEL